MSDLLRFESTSDSGWKVFVLSDDTYLGHVKWFDIQYCFYHDGVSITNPDYMREIAKFLYKKRNDA